MKNSNKIKIAVIGFGRMGITHYSIINSHPDVEITAVVDNSSFLNNILKKNIKKINVYSDFNKLFDNEFLDAIIVCTPPMLHYPIIKKAAENGIHVFCEKPFTANISEAFELTEIFNKNNLINQVGYVNRFNDIFITAKQHLDDGIVGNVLRFKSEMYSRTITKPEEEKTWRNVSNNGGGAVYEVASHAIDLVNFLIGKPDKVTGSCLTSIYSKYVEDAVNSSLLYKNGVSGTFNVNWSDDSFRKPTNKFEVLGSKGKIIADQHSLKIFLKTNSIENNYHEGWNTRYITDLYKQVPFDVRGNEYTAQLYHFIDCIQNGLKENVCSFKDALDTHEIIEAVHNDYKLNAKF